MEENGALVKFLFNENREIEAETQSDGTIIRYIRGLGILSSDSEKAKTYYHYACDEQGSVTHVLDGESGAVLNRYTYDAFGNTTQCEEQIPNRFRYHAEQYDPLTNQYYLRARFYNPVIARFTQEDTYYGDGLNLYRYCANNPIRYADPSGHNICPAQMDLYSKYRQQELSPKDAYNAMRQELGLSAKNPFTAESEGGTKPWYKQGDLVESSLYDAFDTVKTEKGLGVRNPFVKESGSNTPKNKTSLYGQEKYVTEKGLNTVKQHLSGDLSDEFNDAMISRLELAYKNNTKISGADLDFDAHEIYESSMMKNGMSYDNAHEAAKAYYNATEFNFYHSDVIKQNPKLFNNAWFEFWGIERN